MAWTTPTPHWVKYSARSSAPISFHPGPSQISQRSPKTSASSCAPPSSLKLLKTDKSTFSFQPFSVQCLSSFSLVFLKSLCAGCISARLFGKRTRGAWLCWTWDCGRFGDGSRGGRWRDRCFRRFLWLWCLFCRFVLFLWCFDLVVSLFFIICLYWI